MKQIADRIPRAWGRNIGIDGGWYPLVEELDRNIAALAPDYIIYQVKSKFGGLRYYIDDRHILETYGEEIHEQVKALIYAAEDKSLEVCELCGNPGENRAVGTWLWTLCDKCHNIKLEERKSFWDERKGDNQ